MSSYAEESKHNISLMRHNSDLNFKNSMKKIALIAIGFHFAFCRKIYFIPFTKDWIVLFRRRFKETQCLFIHFQCLLFTVLSLSLFIHVVNMHRRSCGDRVGKWVVSLYQKQTKGPRAFVFSKRQEKSQISPSMVR